MKQQFDKDGKASIRLIFAEKEFEVVYQNPKRLEYGKYVIKNAVCDGKVTLTSDDNAAVLTRMAIQNMNEGVHTIIVELDEA